jgi:hypothetical protein
VKLVKLASLALATALAVASIMPAVASAQALDPDTGRQAVLDLGSDMRQAGAFRLVALHGPMGRNACDAYDPAVQAQAALELNDLDQRATDLANRTSGGVHAQAMTEVRSIENAYWDLFHPSVPDRCYVAPGA